MLRTISGSMILLQMRSVLVSGGLLCNLGPHEYPESGLQPMDLMVSEGYSEAKARLSREAMIPIRSGLLLRAMCVSIVLQHPGLSGYSWLLMH